MNKKQLKQAYKERLITEKQFKEQLFELEMQQKERKQQRIYESLSQEDFVKLLEKTRQLRHRVIFLLGYGSGLRISEILNLQAEDIDLERNRIMIRDAKGGKDRIVNIPKQFRKQYKSIFPIKIKARTIEATFIRNSLKSNINRQIGIFQRAGRQIPIYRFHFHCLRHSYATRLLEKGVPINQVQLLLGHSNLATTNRYTKANPEDAIKSVLEAEI